MSFHDDGGGGDATRRFAEILRGDGDEPNSLPLQVTAAILTVLFLAFLLMLVCCMCRCVFRVVYRLAFPLRWGVRSVRRKLHMKRVRQRIARWQPRLAEHPTELCRCPIDASGAGIELAGAEDDDDDDKQADARRYCSSERSVADGKPYCDAHRKQRRSRATALAQRFRNGRYTFAELYYSARQRRFLEERAACEALIDSVVARLRAPDGVPPTEGFVYMYNNEFDLQLQEAHTGTRIVECDEVFFYKIGFTTRDPARRLREHDDAVFPSGTRDGVEFVDYVRVRDVRSAERIVHALLCEERYQRFDAIDCAFEVEWFLVTHESAVDTLRSAAKMVDDALSVARPEKPERDRMRTP